MRLNNILASPSFQNWLSGDPLNISKMLYTPEGKPRHTIFYLAHLSDAERMFFVTLLYSSVESWMRTQTGTGGLRAIVYFDEITGYLPPVYTPPSKGVILRLLKQARAFGVGLLLATQNPVDVDYKALSNAGTWFVGKLQTDQDKQRLLDGLEGLGSGLNRGDYDRMISSLGKRVFLVHNVHTAGPVLMNTRWTMNYLAGPLSLVQIPRLNQLAGGQRSAVLQANPGRSTQPGSSVPQAAAPIPASSGSAFSQTKPGAPSGTTEIFLPHNLTWNQAVQEAGRPFSNDSSGSQLVYRPALIAQAQIRYLDRRYHLDHLVERMALVDNPDDRGLIPWEDFTRAGVEIKTLLQTQPESDARFAPLESPLTDGKLLASMQRDFLDWIFQTGEIRILANPTLKQYAVPGQDRDQFINLCRQTAQTGQQADMGQLNARLKTKREALQQKIAKEERELADDKADLKMRSVEEAGAGLTTVLGLLGGKKRSINSNLTKRRMTANAKADVEESEQALAEMKKQLEEIDKELEEQARIIAEKWAKIAEDITEIPVLPKKADIFLDVFAIAWKPVYQVEVNGDVAELPAWKSA